MKRFNALELYIRERAARFVRDRKDGGNPPTGVTVIGKCDQAVTDEARRLFQEVRKEINRG
jgi:hypothetical protein